MNSGGQLHKPSIEPQQRLSPAVAHDLNNPLAALGNLLHLLEAEPNLTENGRRRLKLAREEIHRLTLFLRESLDAYHDTALREEISIPELLDEIIELYKSRLNGGGIALETHYCEDGHLTVFPQQLRRAFSNLLLNAAEAVSPSGRIQVRVCHAREWSGKTRRGIRVTFADNGSGITRHDLHSILLPFFSTKGIEGSGMGLAIVKDVVSEHDGVLRVRSTTRAGRAGSVVTIFLPAA